MSFLELNNCLKRYGDQTVLENVYLSIDEGEFVAIVGYSGTGKSTLINLFSGMVSPDIGDVRMDGKEITGPSRERGLVFQNYSLLPWLTVLENVLLAVDQCFPNLSKTERIAHAKKYVEMVNLAHAMNKKPAELSGGMRQRVSLARTLSMQPRVLLLDEPLGALDALTRATLQEEILQIWERDRKTVVLITNDVDEAILLADRVIPLLATPHGATLGEPVKIDIPRPRIRREVEHHPAFKEIRRSVVTALTNSRKRSLHAASRPRALAGAEA